MLEIEASMPKRTVVPLFISSSRDCAEEKDAIMRSVDAYNQVARNNLDLEVLAFAQDEGSRGRGERYQLKIKEKRKLRRLPDNMTESLPSIVPLLPGTKYMLRKNEPNGSEFGFVNGADCILESVVLHEDEPPIATVLLDGTLCNLF